MIQNTLPSLWSVISNLHFLCNFNSLLPCNVNIFIGSRDWGVEIFDLGSHTLSLDPGGILIQRSWGKEQCLPVSESMGASGEEKFVNEKNMGQRSGGREKPVSNVNSKKLQGT